MNTTRRGLLTGIGALLCAPAIVRATNIMPVKAWAGDGVALYSTRHPFNPTTVVVRTFDTMMVGGPEVMVFPSLSSFQAGDLVYMGKDGYAHRSRAETSQAGRLDFIGIAV